MAGYHFRESALSRASFCPFPLLPASCLNMDVTARTLAAILDREETLMIKAYAKDSEIER